MYSKNNDILDVDRNKKQAKLFYDRISPYYDYFAGIFEKKHRNKGLKKLNIKKGKIVLEIGYGTGQAIKKIAQKVGTEGKVYGIDISSQMYKITKNRLKKANLLDRVKLSQGDALKISYDENKFDIVFMCFVLELFDTPEIPVMLDKIKAILKEKGKIGIVSLSKENGNSLMVKIYEGLHKKFPKYFDCRPIYVNKALKDAHFNIKTNIKNKMFGLPVEIIVGYKWAIIIFAIGEIVYE